MAPVLRLVRSLNRGQDFDFFFGTSILILNLLQSQDHDIAVQFELQYP